MKNTAFWIYLCLFNFLIVAILGTIMRINAVIPIEGVLHKNFREAHSHFAFYGWITALIYIFSAKLLKEHVNNTPMTKYHIIMIINQISSYGMILTFVYKGYYWGSIVCSSLALFCSVAYFFFLLKDTYKIQSPEIPWLKAGAFFAVFSSIGVFSLAYLMSNKVENMDLQRTAIYFYLHYQYNGFFLLSCIGILLYSLRKRHIILPKKLNKMLFTLLCLGAFLGYLLSILWLKNLSLFVWGASIFIALIQLMGVALLIFFIKNSWEILTFHWHRTQRVLFLTFSTALVLKFLLQFISCIPLFSSIFDNFHLIIAYLHLVLLMGISLFFIWEILDIGLFSFSKALSVPIYSLILGILLNELVLLILGFMTLPNLWGPKLLILSSSIICVSIIGVIRYLKPL